MRDFDADAAVDPEVHVAAADADVGYADDDIFWVGDVWDGTVFEAGISWAVEED